MKKKQFKSESVRLLDLMINSIYTNKDIFLRELISNSSDAIDKLYYRSLTDKELKVNTNDLKIEIIPDHENRTLTIIDNGIGMTQDELENNLGTIAKSGSLSFKEENKDQNDVNIIGQFGVGFYSAFMVADKVEVLTKSTDGKSYLFTSDGKDSFTIEEANKDDVGTTIKLYLKKDQDDEDYSQFASTWTIERLVKKYSDYVRYPIKMMVKESKPKLDEEGKEIEGKFEDVLEEKTLNSMVPLWKKNKNEVTEKDLNEFYKSKFNDYEDPLLSLFVNVNLIFGNDKAILFT